MSEVTGSAMSEQSKMNMEESKYSKSRKSEEDEEEDEDDDGSFSDGDCIIKGEDMIVSMTHYDLYFLNSTILNLV